MGSLGAMAAGSSERYFQNSDGDASIAMPVIGEESNRLSKWCRKVIEGRVPYRAPVAMIVTQMVGGLKSGMVLRLSGCSRFATGKARFVRISSRVCGKASARCDHHARSSQLRVD